MHGFVDGEAYFKHQQLAIHSALSRLCLSPAAHRACNQNINNAEHAVDYCRQCQHQRALVLILKLCRLDGKDCGAKFSRLRERRLSKQRLCALKPVISC